MLANCILLLLLLVLSCMSLNSILFLVLPLMPLLSFLHLSSLLIGIPVLRSMFTSFFTSMSPSSLYIYTLFSQRNRVIILILFSYLSFILFLFFTSFCLKSNSFSYYSSPLCTFFLFNIGFILSINACSIAT